MRKVSVRILVIVLLVLLAGPTLTVAKAATVQAAATQDEISEAINKGMIWLETQQDKTSNSYAAGLGSWPGFYFNGVEDKMATTGLAVLKFETNATEFGLSPLDASYMYHTTVQNGLNYLFAHLEKMTLNTQDHSQGGGSANDDPDQSDPSLDGLGVHANTESAGILDVYDTSIALAAISASGKVNKAKTVTPMTSGVWGWTYAKVAQDMVDWLAWAQTDKTVIDADGNHGEGGWSYLAVNNGYRDLYNRPADQSCSGYAAMGLGYALAFDCKIPPWVTTELNKWILHVQDTADGGSWYRYIGETDVRENILKTGNLLFEMKLANYAPGDQPVKNALTYLKTHWNDPIYGEYGTPDDGWGYLGVSGIPLDDHQAAAYQTMFTTMKGLAYMGIDAFGGINWYDDFATKIVKQQVSSGPLGWWQYSSDEGNSAVAPCPTLITAWALLTLEKAVPPPIDPFPFKKSFEDLLERQADRIESFEHLLERLNASERTSELFRSFENLTRQQEGLLKSFEDMIEAEKPQHGNNWNITMARPIPGLTPAQFINLTDSFENLLHRQCDIKESFMDLLNDSRDHLKTEFPEFLNSTEDLLRSDDDLLRSFEDLVNIIFDFPPSDAPLDIRIQFLESYEDLLGNQSILLEKFEHLIEWYFSLNGDPFANVAVKNVLASSRAVISGDSVNINVTVQDTGNFTETSNVTLYVDSQVMAVQSVSLDSGSSTDIAFAWNTTGFGEGDYTVSASASVVPDEVNTADNTLFSDSTIRILHPGHDVATSNAMPYKTVVGQGYSLNVTVTAANSGSYLETFNVTLYANTTTIGTQPVTITSGNFTRTTFVWNTTGFAYGNYTLSASSSPVQGETADNGITSWVVVTLLGDVTGPNGSPEGIVNMWDVAYITKRFGTVPSQPLWDPNADLNGDGRMDMKDIAIPAKNFLQHA